MEQPKKFENSKLAQRIIAAREAKGWAQSDLAQAVGVVQQAISKLEDGTTVSPTSWRNIADSLNINHDEFRSLMIESKRDKRIYYGEAVPNTKLPNADGNVIEMPKRTVGFTPTIVPGKELVGERNFPIYAAAMGGDGHAIITFDAIDWVKRPSILEHVKDSYGVYIVGDSMDPVYEPGDMALIHPHLPPARGTDVVLFHVPPVDEAECIIKRLVGFNDADWKLKQYNPAKEFTEPRASWPYCHRVVGKYIGR